MDNKKIRFKTLLDNKEFLANLNDAISFSQEKFEIAKKAIKISEKLENKENTKHDLRNLAGVGIGGSAFISLSTMALVPLLTQGNNIDTGSILGLLSLSVGFGAWFLKTITNYKKQDDMSINKEFLENKQYAKNALKDIGAEMTNLNNSIKRFEQIEETTSSKIKLCKEMLEMHKQIRKFIKNNQENNNVKRHLEEIITDGNKLLSKSNLLEKLKNSSKESLNENLNTKKISNNF